MPVLKNPRHERFAQLLAAGNTATAAYVEAGYRLNDSNCARLNGNEWIKARTAELLNRTAAKLDITRESLTKMFLHDRLRADELEQISAAVSAGEKIGRLYGLFIDKAEITGKDGGPIETKEIEGSKIAMAILGLIHRPAEDDK